MAVSDGKYCDDDGNYDPFGSAVYTYGNGCTADGDGCGDRCGIGRSFWLCHFRIENELFVFQRSEENAAKADL